MGGEYEYDPFELAEELRAGEDLGHGDLPGLPMSEDASGLTRRELLRLSKIRVVWIVSEFADPFLHLASALSIFQHIIVAEKIGRVCIIRLLYD